jgi:hypothetical protein
MKILFLFLLPIFAFSQKVDTVYIENSGNKFFLVTEYLSNDTTGYKVVKNIGDTVSASRYILMDVEREITLSSVYAKGFINAERARKNTNSYNKLFQQITNKNIFVETALRDESVFTGDWSLNFDGEIIPGIIRLNANNRLIFNPDKSKVYSITTNLLLSTFTNQITFNFNGVKYDLYKFANGKFATVDGDVKLIKKE